MDDLGRAINIDGMAVDITLQEHPIRAAYLTNLRDFSHMLSLHTGSFLLYLVWELRSPPFYLIKLLYNCTSTTPIISVPLVKRSTHTDKQHMLARFAVLALMVAATALNAKINPHTLCSFSNLVVALLPVCLWTCAEMFPISSASIPIWQTNSHRSETR